MFHLEFLEILMNLNISKVFGYKVCEVVPMTSDKRDIRGIRIVVQFISVTFKAKPVVAQHIR